MERRLGLLATGVAAAVVWLAAAELAWPARALLVFLSAVLPPLSLAQAAMAEAEPEALPRLPVYLSSSAALWVLGAVTLAAARTSGLGASLGVEPLAAAPLVGWTLAATAGALALTTAGHLLGVRESPVLARLLPRSGAERAAFLLLSLSAGVAEELAFRGFLIPALDRATGSTAVAVVGSAALFGVVHAYQRASGAVRAALLGGILTVPFLATGSIVPSMAAHFLYDAVAGLWLGERLLRQ